MKKDQTYSGYGGGGGPGGGRLADYRRRFAHIRAQVSRRGAKRDARSLGAFHFFRGILRRSAQVSDPSSAQVLPPPTAGGVKGSIHHHHSSDIPGSHFLGTSLGNTPPSPTSAGWGWRCPPVPPMHPVSKHFLMVRTSFRS